MHYLKLAPLFVYLLTAAVSARPLDQGVPLPVGDMTLGLVAPTAVPNVKLPVPGGAGATPTGVPPIPHFPGVPSVPGSGSSKSSKVPGVPKGVPLRRSPSPDPGPSYANPRLQPRMVREPDYAAANTNATIPVAPTTSTTKREVKSKEFRNGWVVPPPSSSSTSNHAKRAAKKHRSSKKKHTTDHHKKPSETAQKPTHTNIAKPEHSAEAKPDLKAEHAAEDQHSSSASSSSGAGGPAAGLTNLVKTVGAAPNLLGPVGQSMPSVPDTPITSADTGPTIDAADNTAGDAAQTAKVKVPVDEKVPPPPTDANAYPAYTAPALPAPANTKAKRHSLVLDTDPLIPPSDESKEKKDKAFGVVNMDSNAKPPPPPPVPSVPAKVPKPSVSAAPVPIPSESIYQPKEPGYGGGYAAPTAVPV